MDATLNAEPCRELPPKQALSRGRVAAFRLGAVLFALSAACAIAEVGLRAFGYTRSYTNPGGSFHEPHPLVGSRGKPNFCGRLRQRDFDVVIRHNELGFRQQETYPEMTAAKHDAYILGDSFVWGYGVGQDDAFSNRLSRLLPDRRVHNFGLAGSGTVEQYLIFRHYVYDALRPGDTVVLAFFGNDFGDNVGRFDDRVHAAVEGGEIKLVYPPPPSAWLRVKSKLKDVSALFNLAAFCIDRAWTPSAVTVRAQRNSPALEKIAKDTSDDSPQVKITRHFLAELKHDCDSRQVRLIVAYVPGQSELGEDDVSSTEDLAPAENPAYRAAFFRIAAALGLETLDLLPDMLAAKRADAARRLTFEHDFHWNPHGHEIAARTIAERMNSAAALSCVPPLKR